MACYVMPLTSLMHRTINFSCIIINYGMRMHDIIHLWHEDTDISHLVREQGEKMTEIWHFCEFDFCTNYSLNIYFLIKNEMF